MYRVVLFIISLFFIHGAYGQQREWLDCITGDSLGSYARDLTIDDENNSYFLGSFSNKALNTNDSSAFTLVKYNEIGKRCWHLHFSYIIHAIQYDETTGDIFAIVQTNAVTTLGATTFNASSLVVLRTDTSFAIKDTRLVSDSFKRLNGLRLLVTANEVFIQTSVLQYFNFKGISYTRPTNNYLSIFLRLNKNFASSNNEWCTSVHSNFNTVFLTFGDKIQADGIGNLYSIIRTASSSPTIYVNNLPYNISTSKKNSDTHSILKLNTTTGNFMDVWAFNDARLNSIQLTASGKVFIIGDFIDTFSYKQLSFKATDNFSVSSFLMLLQPTGTPIWGLQDYNSGGGIANSVRFEVSTFKADNLYLSGQIWGTTSIGGFTVSGSGIGLLSSNVNAKFDTLGNCLWVFALKTLPLSSTVSSAKKINVNNNGSPHFISEFSLQTFIIDTLVFGTGNFNAIIYKLSDYAIYRGYIKPGPYCAGDSLEIPYTIKGKYDPGNEFIAQISDEDGNFFGNEREIGRVQSDSDGTIKGPLPLLDVATSANYRIRIISTKPNVQSFYRQDTLRLLIYSRDSANAGPDKLICKGQQIQLTTTGGSKWEWSPTTTLNNPAIRKPIATPIQDTEYRIIISDSSGCGDTDTDYVWVRLRPELKAKAPFFDTTICRGQWLKLNVQGSGGDTAAHFFTWYERRTVGDVKVADNTDTFITTSTQSPKTIFAVLQDSCTLLADTQFYYIRTLPALKVSIKNNINAPNPLLDTLLCYNVGISLFADAKGGLSSGYKFAWVDTTIIASGNKLTMAPANPGVYKVILTDNCTARPDTASISIFQRLPLALTLVTSTKNVCKGLPVQINAIQSGGDSTQYQINWFANNTPFIAQQNPILQTPLITTTYRAELKDNCSPPAADSLTITVLPLPIPNFSITDTIGCPPLLVKFTDNSTGSNTAQNIWKIQQSQVLGTANANTTVYKTGVFFVSLTAKSLVGCSDSLRKKVQVTVFEKPRASFVVKPDKLEIESPIQLLSTSSGASNYQWNIGNSLFINSNGDTTIQLSDTGNYNIQLVAQNKWGCKDTAIKKIHVFDKLTCIIPNSFTPNGDGFNQSFAPVCTGVANYALTIYNRWGQVVFDCENCAWDGNYSYQPIPDGVYMYKIRLFGENDQKSMVYGTVNVIR